MPRIKVDFGRFAQLETQLAQMPGAIDSAAATAASVRCTLDWDVACEEAIDSRLKRISDSLKDCADRMKRTTAFVAEAASLYRKTEELCAQDEAAKAAWKAEGEAWLKQAEQMKVNNAIDCAISRYDSVASYLKSVAEKGGSFWLRAAGAGYDLASFEWVNLAKKLLPNSEVVKDVRRQAIQKAYASMLQMNEPSYTEAEFKQWLANSIVDGGDTLNNVAGGISHLSVLDNWQALDEGVGWVRDIMHIKSAEAVADGECGAIFSALGTAVEAGFDLRQYNQWNDAQQQIFFESLNSAGENLQLLNDIKTAFPEDEILVEYCNDTIQEIEAFLNGDNLTRMIDGCVDSGKIAGGALVIGKDVLEGSLDYAIPEVIGMGLEKTLGRYGGAVTAVGSGTGYAAELVFGTGTTAETFDHVSILYSNIEASIYAYTDASSKGTMSPAAQRFQELNILNQKLAALDMTTSLNQKLGRKDAERADAVDSMKNSLLRSYEALEP